MLITTILAGSLTFAVAVVSPFKLTALGYTTLMQNTNFVYPPVSGNNFLFNVAISPLLTLQVSGIFTVTPLGNPVYTLVNPSYTVLQGPPTLSQSTPGYLPFNDPYWAIIYQPLMRYVESLKQV